MPQQLGRSCTVDMDFGAGDENLAGVKSVTVTVNNELIDITNNDSAGYAEMLGSAKVGLTLALNGLHGDDAVMASIRGKINSGAQTTTDFSVNIPGTSGGSAASWDFSGLFESLEEAGETEGAMNYNVTVKSTGTLTVTDVS